MKITYKTKESRNWDKFDVIVFLKDLGYQETQREEDWSDSSLSGMITQIFGGEEQKFEPRSYYEHTEWDSDYTALLALSETSLSSPTGHLKLVDIKNEAQLTKFIQK